MPEAGMAWTCPFCDRDTIIVSSNFYTSGTSFDIENIHGDRYLSFYFIVCPNPTDRCILSLTFLHVLSSAHGPKTWPVQNMESRAPKAGAGTQATRMETVRDRRGFGCLSRRGQPVGGRNPGARQ
jgi:hypothetical protein